MCDTATPAVVFDWNQSPRRLRLYATLRDKTVGDWLMARWGDGDQEDLIAQLVERCPELTPEAIRSFMKQREGAESAQISAEATSTEAEPPSDAPLPESDAGGDSNQSVVSGLLPDLIAEIVADPHRFEGFFEGRPELVWEMLEYYTEN